MPRSSAGRTSNAAMRAGARPRSDLREFWMPHSSAGEGKVGSAAFELTDALLHRHSHVPSDGRLVRLAHGVHTDGEGRLRRENAADFAFVLRSGLATHWTEHGGRGVVVTTITTPAGSTDRALAVSSLASKSHVRPRVPPPSPASPSPFFHSEPRRTAPAGTPNATRPIRCRCIKFQEQHARASRAAAPA